MKRFSLIQRLVVIVMAVGLAAALIVGFWPLHANVFGDATYSCGSGFIHSEHTWNVDSTALQFQRTGDETATGLPASVCPDKVAGAKDLSLLLLAISLAIGLLFTLLFSRHASATSDRRCSRTGAESSRERRWRCGARNRKTRASSSSRLLPVTMALTDGRLFHVNLNCADLERSRRFYVDGLGLTAGARTATEDAQPGAAFGLDRARWDAWILLGPNGFDGAAIDLLEWQEPTPIGRAPAAVTTCGFQRLGLMVPDFDAALERVNALGGATWSESFTHTVPGGGEIRLVMANDPDGVVLELVEGDGPRVAFVRGGLPGSRTVGRVLRVVGLPRRSRASRARTTMARTCGSTDRSRWKR